MNLLPSSSLRNRDVTRGLNLVIREGLISEAMTTLTGGTFLMAMAILLGASNFQIGLVAALPTMTNIFQMVTTRLLQKYNNRRLITVIANGFARLPLLVIGALPLLFSANTSFATIIFILVFHYSFGSIAGASWNSWMKDLVPGSKLGSYFSKRTSATQTLNVFLSLAIALMLDYVKANHPGYELTTYALMFIAGGSLGLVGTWLLSRTPEPVSYLPKGNLFKLYRKPFADSNYRRLLTFQFSWTFALSIATPFLTVFLLKNLGLKLSTVIAAGMCAQIAGILAVKKWGRYADQFSNKTILRTAAPIYILCLLFWPLPALYSSPGLKVALVILLNIMSGMATAGINLSLNNITIKLAPANEAVVYLSAKSMVMALTGGLSPLFGGFMADYFSHKKFTVAVNMHGFAGYDSIRLIDLQNYGFLFLIGAILALGALQLLNRVKEDVQPSFHEKGFSLKIFFESSLARLLNPVALMQAIRVPVQKRIQFHRKFRNRVAKKMNLAR